MGHPELNLVPPEDKSPNVPTLGDCCVHGKVLFFGHTYGMLFRKGEILFHLRAPSSTTYPWF